MNRLKKYILEKIVEPATRDCTTRACRICNLCFLALGSLGLLALFVFLISQILTACFSSAYMYEDWKADCKEQGYSIETGVATYLGSELVPKSGLHTTFLIQSKSGKNILLDYSTTPYVISSSPDSWDCCYSYEGLTFPVEYVSGSPDKYWIFFERPCIADSAIKIVKGKIIKARAVGHLTRIILSFEVETNNGKKEFVEEQYLPLSCLELCKKLKREKRAVSIRLSPYIFNDACRDHSLYTDTDTPHSESMPKITPRLDYMPYEAHPWIASIILDKS